MARRNGSEIDFVRPVRRILVAGMILVCLGIFLLWRLDSPRVERFRANLLDRVVPSFEWASVPVARFTDMMRKRRRA